MRFQYKPWNWCFRIKGMNTWSLIIPASPFPTQTQCNKKGHCYRILWKKNDSKHLIFITANYYYLLYDIAFANLSGGQKENMNFWGILSLIEWRKKYFFLKYSILSRRNGIEWWIVKVWIKFHITAIKISVIGRWWTQPIDHPW